MYSLSSMPVSYTHLDVYKRQLENLINGTTVPDTIIKKEKELLRAKPVWEVYRKAGTNEEDEYFEQFLPLIGIPDWNIIENF